MILRDYQQHAVDAARRSIASGHRSVLLVSPTGSGKTAIGADIVRRALARGRKVLWVAHRNELIVQAYNRLVGCELTPGVIAGMWPDAPVSDCLQVASIQTLVAREHRPEADLLVLDEAHHYVSDEWNELAEYYRKATVIGLTATPQRADGRGLGALFDDLIPVASIKQLQEAGYLVPCEVLRPPAPLGPNELAESPVKAYQLHADGRHAVVFCPNRARAAEVLQEFFDAGITEAAMLTGDMPADVRRQVLADYATQQIRVLVNVHILTEGWDVPHTDVCILARGCSSAGTYIQMVGRVLRPSPGKTEAIVIDLRGASHVHGAPDDEREYSLAGKGIRKAGELPSERFCPVCASLLDEDGSCPMCGQESTQEQTRVRVLGIALEKYAAKRKEPLEVRREAFRRWMADAKARGFKPGWAAHKYKVVYGEWPKRGAA